MVIAVAFLSLKSLKAGALGPRGPGPFIYSVYMRVPGPGHPRAATSGGIARTTELQVSSRQVPGQGIARSDECRRRGLPRRVTQRRPPAKERLTAANVA